MRFLSRSKALSLGLAVTAAISFAAATAPSAQAAPTICMRYGLATCDPLFERFSDDWWVCYWAAVDECELTGVSWTPSDADRLRTTPQLPSMAEIYRERLLEPKPV